MTKPPASLRLTDRAGDDLRFIRKTMERGIAFTAVPGWGGALMGVTALGAAFLAAGQPTREGWLIVWLCEAALALAVGLFAIHRKAHRSGASILTGSGRRFAANFLPPATAGALLTLALATQGAADFLPGLWLLLYGTAVVTGGAFSVRPVLVMGLLFMALGALALLGPAEWGDSLMALGFGGLHILFGIHIGRHHGG
jgi:hypothetical protein